MLIPVPKTVGDILAHSSQFAIPLYQREYKWGKEEATELIEDLNNYQQPNGQKHGLFLGNFILEKTKNHKTCIVDGQQRLTTIILLLIACKRRAVELGMSQVASFIQQKISFTHLTQEGVSLGCRLIASDSIRNVFEFIADPKWDGTFPAKLGKTSVIRQSNRIRPIYEFFFKQVTELTKPEFSNFLDAIYSAYVFSVEVENEEEALSIFERTNGRGQDLEISDLLKNYLFSKKVEDINEAWKEIQINSGGTILRLLKYFYVSKKGYILKPKLYNSLKKYGDEITPEKLTTSLAEFSRFYRMVKAADEKETKKYFNDIEVYGMSRKPDRYKAVWSALQGLKAFNVIQFCPVAYAAIECLIRNGAKDSDGHAKKLVSLFQTFEKYHFINNAVCETIGNTVERLYAEYSKEYAKESSNFMSVTDKLINTLRGQLASFDEFKSQFCAISYGDQSPLILYILDRFNNKHLEVDQGTRIFDPTQDVDRHGFTLEHFFAQKYKDKTKDKKAEQHFDNIGNLLPLYFKDNGKLGSASPAEKLEMLTNGKKLENNVHNLPIIKDFICKYGKDIATWDKSKIKKRAEDMALEAYKTIWAI